MTVKRKFEKPAELKQYDIDDIINRGGKIAENDKNFLGKVELQPRFTLRLPKKLLGLIDEKRSSRIGNVSRNQWIIEAILDSLES